MQTFQLGTPLTKDQDTYWPVSYNFVLSREDWEGIYTPYTLEELDLELISEQRLQIVQPLTKQKKIDITVFNCLCLIQNLFNWVKYMLLNHYVMIKTQQSTNSKTLMLQL